MSSAASASAAAENAQRTKYLKETNVHHLFELLASRVLSQQPPDIYQFLRDQITDIERVEKQSKKHDPSQIPGRASPARNSLGASPTTGSASAWAPQQQQPANAKLTLAVFGLDGAGKTALISAIGGNPTSETRPTVGFNPTFFETDTSDVCMFDLGGASTFRAIWRHYYHDLHGIIFVVDGSDASRFAEAAACLKELVEHEYVREKPLLLYINKRDKPGFVGVDAVTQRLGADVIAAARTSRPFKMLPVCAINENVEAEQNIESGLEWLLTTIKQYFDSLSRLVTVHSVEVKEKKKRDMEAMAARVAAGRDKEN